jgi:lipid II:glycine glycyltransferase (peptidoglycan interpeptide bridge formation enzyme)
MNNSFLGMVYLKAKLISAALFLYYGIYGHYHLAASLEEYDSCCPNNFLVYNAALYLKKKGIQLLHLGGGSSPDEQNSLFKFKKRFSNKFFDFFIGKMIFDQTVYKKLCQSWEDKFPEKKDLYKERLLRYRF